MKINFALLICLIVSPFLQSYSQEIVVNEYFNAASQNDEWTELVVVKDDLSLVGWYLGDNNEATSSWQPKLRFKNHPLWQHLRAGTIIIIDHAANAAGCDDQTDVEKNDGFIRVCCRNTTYFEGGATTTLFLADNGDFVHLIDPSGKMVHGIGHDDNPGTSIQGGSCFTQSNNWTNTTTAQSATRPCGNFLFYRFRMQAPTTLKVIAGTTADFFAGMQTSTSNPYIDTSDVPQEGIGNGLANNQWLTNLRSPIMQSQNVCLENLPDGSKRFSWAPATDPYPQDGTIGYLILRNQTGEFSNPVSGIQHAVGATIGSGNTAASVVGIINNSQTTTFTDAPGPGNFQYRVYAFRYQNTPSFMHSTRGRSYNIQNFVSVASLPPIPVRVINDTLCGPGSATLTFERVAMPNPMPVNWYTTAVGGTPILANSDTLRISVSQTTSYWFEWQTLSGCTLSRVEVKAVLSPLTVSYNQTATACTGVAHKVSAEVKPNIQYEWKVINPVSGMIVQGLDSSTLVFTLPPFSPSRWLYFTFEARDAKGCSSGLKKDSVWAVGFKPELVANLSNPVEGDTVRLRVQPYTADMVFSNWTYAPATLLSEAEGSILVQPVPDSLKASVFVVQKGMGSAPFCQAKAQISLPVLPKPEPLLPINNLITRNGDEKNKTLNFDRREVRHLHIYNRWGKEIYHAGSYKNDWEPSEKPGTVYFYQAEVRENARQEFKVISGWVWVVE